MSAPMLAVSTSRCSVCSTLEKWVNISLTTASAALASSAGTPEPLELSQHEVRKKLSWMTEKFDSGLMFFASSVKTRMAFWTSAGTCFAYFWLIFPSSLMHRGASMSLMYSMKYSRTTSACLETSWQRSTQAAMSFTMFWSLERGSSHFCLWLLNGFTLVCWKYQWISSEASFSRASTSWNLGAARPGISVNRQTYCRSITWR
mmetsp:Transcript_1771/g.2440  ORF Transcript_1771/g.2440 Transcript_1771/m.2440 type:complete len:203 (+) Transcript_1771:1875-2483(+)